MAAGIGNPDIGIRHNFFEAGGDSIKAMQIVGMMKKEGMMLNYADCLNIQQSKSL